MEGEDGERDDQVVLYLASRAGEPAGGYVGLGGLGFGPIERGVAEGRLGGGREEGREWAENGREWLVNGVALGLLGLGPEPSGSGSGKSDSSLRVLACECMCANMRSKEARCCSNGSKEVKGSALGLLPKSPPTLDLKSAPNPPVKLLAKLPPNMDWGLPLRPPAVPGLARGGGANRAPASSSPKAAKLPGLEDLGRSVPTPLS